LRVNYEVEADRKWILLFRP